MPFKTVWGITWGIEREKGGFCVFSEGSVCNEEVCGNSLKNGSGSRISLVRKGGLEPLCPCER
jgi:hypothetical protein